MKKNLMLISMMLVFSASLMSCATTGDLEKVQEQQKMNNAKAEQALQDAQAAKAAADAAALKADNATARADEATKRAEERERAANEKAQKADSLFKNSMKK